MGKLPRGVRMVYFDAVGTLLFPEPSPGEAYLRAGQRFGSRVALEEAKARFRRAFASQERLDARGGNRTSEEHERRRWRAIVAEVLPDVSDPEACFVSLWEHFASPANWRVAPGVDALMDSLARRGVGVGIASNFDARLLGLVDGKEQLRGRLDAVVCSSLVGWRKPAREFYQALLRGHAPAEVLMVGDDPENDYQGARAAGLHALLLDGDAKLEGLI